MAAGSRDRLIVLASLVAISGLAWAYLLALSRDMDMPGMSTPPAAFPLTAAMWAAMMVGMMLPSAMPMILIFMKVQRKQGAVPLAAAAAFAAGYLAIWGGFALAAAALQVWLGGMALLSASMTLVSTRLAGAAFLLAAGYEVSPLKERCLTQCSNPIGFITSYWEPDAAGAFRMGARHGAFCVGCCWALMLLLFAAGVMDLLWVAVLSVLVLLQKALPCPRIAATSAGIAMAAAGFVLVLR